jgi:nucleoid-associated protein YgaU
MAMTLVLAGALVGCEKNNGPSAEEAEMPTRPIGELKPVEQPPDMATTPAPAPRSIEDLTAPPPPRDITPPPPPEPTPTTYVVRKGDTLWSIAERLLGNGKRWQEIVAANPGIEPHRLPVGKKLLIPPK